MKQKNSNSKTS